MSRLYATSLTSIRVSVCLSACVFITLVDCDHHEKWKCAFDTIVWCLGYLQAETDPGRDIL